MSTSNRLYSTLPGLHENKNVAEVDLDALVYNYKLLSKYTKDGIKKICVVKADAYGHGSDQCVAALARAGCDMFAVSGIDEAISVRNTCRHHKTDADILILGYTLPTQAGLLAKNDITQAILSLDYAKALSSEAQKLGVNVKCHIAVDSGMNRIGLCAHNSEEIVIASNEACEMFSLGGITVCGMFTHFADADNEYMITSSEDSHTREQYRRFYRLLSLIKEKGVDPGLCHVCNSAASVRFEDYHLGGVRFGIMLYGAPPSCHISLPLKPVMKLKTIISHIHTLLPGESVSYSRTFSSSEKREIATLPIGYADGFIRAYSGAYVSVHKSDGKTVKAPVVGRICMDQCMIDVTGCDVHVGDEVVLFGDDETQLSELALKAGTIEYECLCLVSARVPRVYY